MKNEKIPIWGEIPEVGSEYLKLKTEEIVKWKSFNKKAKIFEINLPTGEISKVHQRDVKRPTANEVADFLAAKNKISN